MSGSGQRGSSRPSGVAQLAQAFEADRLGQVREVAPAALGVAQAPAAASSGRACSERFQAVAQLVEVHGVSSLSRARHCGECTGSTVS